MSITGKYSDSEVYIVTALPACTQQAADEGRKQGTYHKTELWYRKPRFNILLILFLYTSYFSAHILKYIPEDRMEKLNGTDGNNNYVQNTATQRYF